MTSRFRLRVIVLLAAFLAGSVGHAAAVDMPLQMALGGLSAADGGPCDGCSADADAAPDCGQDCVAPFTGLSHDGERAWRAPAAAFVAMPAFGLTAHTGPPDGHPPKPSS